MIRSRFIVVVICVLAVAATFLGCGGEPKQQGQDQKFATPEATFQTAKQAVGNGDLETFCQCFTDEGLSLMAGSMRMMTGMIHFIGSQEGADEQSAKLAQGIDQINREYVNSDPPQVNLNMNAPEAEIMAGVRKMAEPIKDRAAYLGAVFKLMLDNAPADMPQPMADAKLQDVQITDNTATATILGTVLMPGKNDTPITFRQVDQAWKIDQLGSFWHEGENRIKPWTTFDKRTNEAGRCLACSAAWCL